MTTRRKFVAASGKAERATPVMTPSTCSDVDLGVVGQLARLADRRHRRQFVHPSDSAGSGQRSAGAGFEQGFRVRAGNGGEFCHGCSPLQLCLQAVQQISMDASIDFLAEDLLSALHGQRSHLLTQGFTGCNGLLLSFGAGQRQQSCCLLLSHGLWPLQ